MKSNSMRHALGFIIFTSLPVFAADAPDASKGLVYRQGTFFVVDQPKPAIDIPTKDIKNDTVKVDAKLLESIYGQPAPEQRKQ